MSYIYPLPTTGTISWSDFLLDENNLYLSEISEATAQRGRVREALKDAKRTEGPKDYTKIMNVIYIYFILIQILEIFLLIIFGNIEFLYRQLMIIYHIYLV
jgi:hypothetical protein